MNEKMRRLGKKKHPASGCLGKRSKKNQTPRHSGVWRSVVVLVLVRGRFIISKPDLSYNFCQWRYCDTSLAKRQPNWSMLIQS